MRKCPFQKEFDPSMSDGCTLWPDGSWRHCCVEHDRAYYYGGSFDDRKRADIELMKCVLGTEKPILSFIMYLGVRFFAGPLWPHRARWGYSLPYCHSFTYKKNKGCRDELRKMNGFT